MKSRERGKNGKTPQYPSPQNSEQHQNHTKKRKSREKRKWAEIHGAKRIWSRTIIRLTLDRVSPQMSLKHEHRKHLLSPPQAAQASSLWGVLCGLCNSCQPMELQRKEQGKKQVAPYLLGSLWQGPFCYTAAGICHSFQSLLQCCTLKPPIFCLKKSNFSIYK